MNYSKLFFPVGGGEELKERIHGALLISKYFNAHLEVLSTTGKPSFKIENDEKLSPSLEKELIAMKRNMVEEKIHLPQKYLKQECKELNIDISAKKEKDKPTAEIIMHTGLRSELVQEESKFCDLVIVASPPNGRITSTFENTITKSGKPAIMFPRTMKKFRAENILIGWNNSAQCSKAISLAIPLMQKAKHVRIVTSSEFVSKISQIKKLQDYLKMHDINTTYDIIATTKIPGQALLNFAKDHGFDIIIAGAFGRKGFREIMLGGTTKYILEHTAIPIFMAH
jgi:nucleotide-binding universal stress UspA family protein